jgi:hypothetical protein
MKNGRSLYLRNFKNISKNTESVSEIVGILVMIIIITVISTTLYTSMGQTTDSKLHATPIVSMIQIKNQIQIVNIQFGDVFPEEINISIIDRNGNIVDYGTLLSTGPILKAGDTITIPDGLLSVGSYRVQMIYRLRQVGIVK